MENEIECNNKNNTWKLVNRVHEKKSLRCKMGLYEKIRR